MPKQATRIAIAVRIEPELYERVEQAAKVEGRTLANLSRQALVEYLNVHYPQGQPIADTMRAVKPRSRAQSAAPGTKAKG